MRAAAKTIVPQNIILNILCLRASMPGWPLGSFRKPLREVTIVKCQVLLVAALFCLACAC